ncbi:MAG: hypothetical protein ISS15_20465 [Alphaproteobacteria bacterium]|nr:hypothetical protein [Alphaproteobacteria bacterium]MBL7100038.1 hypothetical protein [Alphaproteobacteria bacterium]
MRRSYFAPAILALAAATATGAQAEPKLIYKIDKVTAAIIKNRLVVSASGAVNSGGWTAPRLHLLPHKPEDNTETIEFQAQPPIDQAVVIQALLPIQTTAVFPLPHYGVTQITVVGDTNAVTAPLQMPPAAAGAPASRGR